MISSETKWSEQFHLTNLIYNKNEVERRAILFKTNLFKPKFSG